MVWLEESFTCRWRGRLLEELRESSEAGKPRGNHGLGLGQTRHIQLRGGGELGRVGKNSWAGRGAAVGGLCPAGAAPSACCGWGPGRRCRGAGEGSPHGGVPVGERVEWAARVSIPPGAQQLCCPGRVTWPLGLVYLTYKEGIITTMIILLSKAYPEYLNTVFCHA